MIKSPVLKGHVVGLMFVSNRIGAMYISNALMLCLNEALMRCGPLASVQVF